MRRQSDQLILADGNGKPLGLYTSESVMWEAILGYTGLSERRAAMRYRVRLNDERTACTPGHLTDILRKNGRVLIYDRKDKVVFKAWVCPVDNKLTPPVPTITNIAFAQ